jgi:hypothetical protein
MGKFSKEFKIFKNKSVMNGETMEVLDLLP